MAEAHLTQWGEQGHRDGGSLRVAFIWQMFLPYHVARLAAAARCLSDAAHDIVAVEVASHDASYAFPRRDEVTAFRRRVAFPGNSYHTLGAGDVLRGVSSLLRAEAPDVVFAPATPFPEGIAAIRYRADSGARVVMMDDAWEWTDRRGLLTRTLKRLIHRNVDGAFIPAPSHSSYYQGLGFPLDRLVEGVDAVDNEYFARGVKRFRAAAGVSETGPAGAPPFLFVGRLLERKGVETLLEAYATYARHAGDAAWPLEIVGDGPAAPRLRARCTLGGVRFLGPRFGDDLCASYARAGALVVPSDSDPWALVVNEGMASGLPVIVSRGCGCARTLVWEGENGWTFAPGDAAALARLLAQVSDLSPETRAGMGRRSREIVADWGLDRFASGVVRALELPRRPPAGLLSDLAVRSWKGRIRVT